MLLLCGDGAGEVENKRHDLTCVGSWDALRCEPRLASPRQRPAANGTGSIREEPSPCCNYYRHPHVCLPSSSPRVQNEKGRLRLRRCMALGRAIPLRGSSSAHETIRWVLAITSKSVGRLSRTILLRIQWHSTGYTDKRVSISKRRDYLS